MTTHLSTKGPGTVPVFRLERLNTDKTRKESGSVAEYHVYFELSGSPPADWRTIFTREWTELHIPHKVEVEGSFLILHCQLEEVTPAQLAILQKAVRNTNEAYGQFARAEATAVARREGRWQEERQKVEAIAALLHFD